MTKKNKYILAFFSCLALSLASIHGVSALDVGVNEVNSTIQLSSANPITIAARIINILMMFLGAIAVSLVIFAGFKWMTSNGNEENVAAAKKILKNSVIGLLIILSSWGIVSFILGRLLGDTGVGGLNGNNARGNANLGSGALGNCTVQSVYPEPDAKEVPRNVNIMITFKEEPKLDTVCVNASNSACACNNTASCNRLNKDNFKIYEGFGAPESASSTDAIVTYSSSSKTLIMSPVSYLGSPSENTWYTVYLSNSVEAISGCANGRASCGMFASCATDYFRWQFEVSTKLDLTPPQVVAGGVFPEPDNSRDVTTGTSVLATAAGSFRVIGTPNVYAPAKVGPITTSGTSQPASVNLESNYSETETAGFKVTVMLGNKAQLYKDNVSLGLADFSGKQVNFPGYLTLVVGGNGSYSPGDMWETTITAAKLADTITIGSDVYTFVTSTSSGYNIQANSNSVSQASIIATALSFRTDVLVSINNSSNTTIDISSKVAGLGGNNIILASNSSAITTSAMHGGADSVQTTEVNGKSDKPMNSTIQMNFNEAVNPMTVSGNAGDVKDTIRVVNNVGTKANNTVCSNDSDCLSYKCTSGKCVGDYLDGKFEISNAYKTVEFRSNIECGMNGCGEKIYCLPADSNLRVKLIAGSLQSCATDTDCASKSPFTKCLQVNKYKTLKACQDIDGQNYPVSSVTPMVGVMDASFNSLDGNRNQRADGSGSFYDENQGSNLSTVDSCNQQYNNILKAVINARIAKNTVLGGVGGGGVTGVYCTRCACSPGLIVNGVLIYNPTNCILNANRSFIKLGFSGAQYDYAGALWWLDENEEETSACSLDTMSSANCGGYSFPLFLSHSVKYNVDCPADKVYNNNLSYWEKPFALDDYSWAFMINNQIDATPPVITGIVPSSDGNGANLSDPVTVDFSKMIMSSSLKSGSTKIDIGTTTVEHRLLNLKSSANVPTGYWITSENIDTSANGAVTRTTQAKINHSMFEETIDYVSQVGSGVKDIYQNCFKPSAGPGCAADQSLPSCCNGSKESILKDGSCAVNN